MSRIYGRIDWYCRVWDIFNYVETDFV